MTHEETQELLAAVKGFLAKHKAEMYRMSDAEPHIFEATCYMITALYYERNGYTLEARKLYKGRFRFRFSTAGNPWNFSYFCINIPDTGARPTPVGELRHNQSVVGCLRDSQHSDSGLPPLFALDVAVVKPGALPDLHSCER